jgi:hypothetical protein
MTGPFNPVEVVWGFIETVAADTGFDSVFVNTRTFTLLNAFIRVVTGHHR